MSDNQSRDNVWRVRVGNDIRTLREMAENLMGDLPEGVPDELRRIADELEAKIAPPHDPD